MIHARYAAITLAMAALASGAARADEPGFYVGAGLGIAHEKGGEFDGSATSFRGFAGYSINRYFAAEAGYIDGGKQTDTVDSLDIAIRSDGYFVAGLAKLPVTKHLAPYAKLGYVFYDTNTKVSSGPNSISRSRSDHDLLFGIGCELSNGDPFRFRIEWEKVRVPDADFRILSVSGTWQF